MAVGSSPTGPTIIIDYQIVIIYYWQNQRQKQGFTLTMWDPSTKVFLGYPDYFSCHKWRGGNPNKLKVSILTNNIRVKTSINKQLPFQELLTS